MSIAMLYAEPERGRGKIDAGRKSAETADISYRRLAAARQVLRANADLACSVRDGVTAIICAAEKIKRALYLAVA